MLVLQILYMVYLNKWEEVDKWFLHLKLDRIDIEASAKVKPVGAIDTDASLPTSVLVVLHLHHAIPHAALPLM